MTGNMLVLHLSTVENNKQKTVRRTQNQTKASRFETEFRLPRWVIIAIIVEYVEATSERVNA